MKEGAIEIATITWEAYYGNTATWTDLSTNRLVFSGSTTNINTTVQATQFQSGTHIGSSTPGSDLCGTNHIPNVKLISGTQWQLGAGSTATISNIAETSCTFRLRFLDGSTYALQNGRIYSYDSVTTTNEAVGVDAALWVKPFEAESLPTAWTCINSDTATGPAVSGLATANGFQTANVGGNNAGEFYALNSRVTANTTHDYYAALSCSPETAGGKASFALGAYLEYY